MNAYKVTFKKHNNARIINTFECRFHDNLETAIRLAEKALDEEYYGEAVLLNVEETEDPRN